MKSATVGGGYGDSAWLAEQMALCSDVPFGGVAAGGIADGRGLVAALVLGAGGALCGTAFVAAVESLGPVQARQRLLQSDALLGSPRVHSSETH